MLFKIAICYAYLCFFEKILFKKGFVSLCFLVKNKLILSLYKGLVLIISVGENTIFLA